MGWLYVGSVLIKASVNVSPGCSAHITMDDTLVPEDKQACGYKSLPLHFVQSKIKPMPIFIVTSHIACAT